MPESMNGGPPPEILENGGNIPEKGKEEEIIIEARYKGEDPKAFIIGILESAHQEGIPLTFKEVLKQIGDLTAQPKEEEFSFDKMQVKSTDAVINIPIDITIIIKIKRPTGEEKITEEEIKPEETEEIDEYDDDDDDDPDDNERKDKTPQKSKKKKDLLETETMKVRKVLDTREGALLDQSLEEIRRIGLRLIEKLRSLKTTNSIDLAMKETAELVTDRLELFRFLEEAQSIENILTVKLKKEYDFTPRRDLVPTGFILSYLQNEYRKNNIEMPHQLLENTNLPPDTSGSIEKAVRERLQ